MNNRTGIFICLVSLCVGLVLQCIALPPDIAPLKPLWIPLLMAGWTYHAPWQPNLLFAFIAGLCLDVLFNCPLGQHALALVLLTYLVARIRPSLLLSPPWQAYVTMIPLWAGYILLLAVIDKLTHHYAPLGLRWWPLLPTVIVWPLIDMGLYRIVHRRRSPAE